MRTWWRSRLVHRGRIANRDVLQEIVRRIVAVADPEQIILFGSAARGQMRARSDYDLLVVKSGVTDPHQFARHIHTNLFGMPVPIDIVVATPEHLREARDKIWTLLGQAQADGKPIYRGRRP